MRVIPASAKRSNQKTLVCIFLRGGIDGLNTIVPAGDSNYYDHRPGLAIPENQLIEFDDNSFYGINPSFADIKEIYEDGKLAIFPAAHTDSISLSHFEGQNMLCTGLTKEMESGLLNRALASLNIPSSDKLPAVSLGHKTHELLGGDFIVTSFGNVDEFLRMSSRKGAMSLAKTYGKSDLAGSGTYPQMLSELGKETFKNINLVRDIFEDKNLVSKVNYGIDSADGQDQDFLRQLQTAAHLIRNSDIRAITIDYGDFDTHQNQASEMPGLLRTLSKGMLSFYKDLGKKMDDVTVLVMSEFGRTVVENGSNGTDHGRGTTWFAFGNKVQGGFYGDWPGLANNQLREERYLDYSIDCGNIISEALIKTMGVQEIGSIFDDFSYQEIGFIT